MWRYTIDTDWSCKSWPAEYRISANQAHPMDLGVGVCRHMGAAAQALWQETAQPSACCHSRRQKPKAWAHNWHRLVDKVLHRAGRSTISTISSLSRQGSPLHGIPPDNFDGLAWASYDAAYCRQAANNLSLDWAIPDQALYNEAFTGRARVIPHCQFCLSDSHLSHDCTFGPGDFRHSQNRQPSSRRGAVRTQVAQICRLFNQPGGNQYHFKQCRYAHLLASATGHTQCLSVTGASATVPGQPRLQARRGKRTTGRLLLMHLLLTC